jgi:hypothetical protein
MCAEASTVLRAVAADFFFNCWYLEIPSDNRISSLTVGIWRSLRITVFGTYQGVYTIMRKAFDRKRSRISMLGVEAVPQNCIP